MRPPVPPTQFNPNALNEIRCGYTVSTDNAGGGNGTGNNNNDNNGGGAGGSGGGGNGRGGDGDDGESNFEADDKGYSYLVAGLFGLGWITSLKKIDRD